MNMVKNKALHKEPCGIILAIRENRNVDWIGGWFMAETVA